MATLGKTLVLDGPAKGAFLTRAARIDRDRVFPSVCSFGNQQHQEERPRGVVHGLGKHPARQPLDVQGLESGLWIAETPPAPPQIVSDPAIRCAACDKASLGGVGAQLFWHTRDGFERHWPTCGHGQYWLCPTCVFKVSENAVNAAYLDGCPVCGCGEEKN